MLNEQRSILLFTLFSIHLLQSTTSNPIPSYPCKPPHHSHYSFCDKSLPITTRVNSLISLLTLSDKIQQLSNNASSIPNLGIPPYQWWSESLHGIATNGPGVSFNGTVKSATDFPQVIVSAASFNRSLWFLIGSAVGVEGRSMFNLGQAGLTYWAPNVNIFRDPRWGRGQETPGEDPMLASAYAIQFVRGLQGVQGIKTVFHDHHDHYHDHDDDGLMVSACCKHFTAYDLEKWGEFARYNFNAVVSFFIFYFFAICFGEMMKFEKFGFLLLDWHDVFGFG